MAVEPDPYRTLGLKRGATLDEVKRAYRRLAKINHPDAAGEAALPRFLAIQAAYERLAGPGAPGVARRPPAPRRPWDPAADATRRAYGGRARNAPPGAGPTGAGGAAGTTGNGGETDAGADAGGGAAGTPGSASGGGWSRRTGSTGKGGAPGASGRPGRRRTYEPRPDSGTPGSPPPGGKPRQPNKATFGSTSYDGADADPFEPDWGGASWYGNTSGTYWTLNPKEYADPRKHGPEYQARARRAARARAGDPARPAPDPETSEGTANEPGDQPHEGRPADPTHTTSSWWDSTAGATGEPDAPEDGGPATGPFPGAPPRDAYARTQADTTGAPWTDGPPPPDLGRAAADITRALTDERFGGARGRLGRALVGWLPVALGLSWVVGEMTGCGRFAATCDDGLAGPLLFVVQILAFAILLAIPAAASIATMAALMLLAAAVVASLVLSATGGAADGDSRRAVLGLILLLAWLAGLTIAVVRRARTFRSGTSPVS